jgi:hypothetical protein
LQQLGPTEIVEIAAQEPANAQLRLTVEGESLEGGMVTKTVALPLGPKASGEERLEKAGLALRTEGDKVIVDDVAWDSPAQQAGIEFDWEIKTIEMPKEQPTKYWMFIPPLLVLWLIVTLQRRRQEPEPSAA